MNPTAAGFPFTVTDVPSRLSGKWPFTISVVGFHLRASPAGARPVPKMATHEPGEIAPPAARLASFTIPVMVGFASGAAIVRVKVCGIDVVPVLSWTVTLNKNGLPVALPGVPLSMAVEALRVKPGGSVPLATVQLEYGGLPPTAVSLVGSREQVCGNLR